MNAAAILVAMVLVVAPGLALTFVLFRREAASLSTSLALIVPFGYASVALLSFVLALSHVLTTGVFVGAFVAATVGLWVAAVRTNRPGGFRAQITAWGQEIRAEPLPLLGGLAVIAALAVTRLTYSPFLNLADQTPLRYWADGLEIADAHRIPALTFQWGHLVPTTVSKVALNSFHAAGALVLGRGPLAPLGALLLVAAVGLYLGAFGLARELGLRLTAPFVPVLLFANAMLGPRNLTQDLIDNRAENWGRLLMLAAVVLAIRALRATDPTVRLRWSVAAGALFGVGSATHLIPTLIGLTFVAAWAAVRAVGQGTRRRPMAVAGGVTAGVAIVLGALILLAAPGQVALGGGTDASSYRRVAAELGQPPSFDPTRYLALGEIRQEAPIHGFYDPPATTYYEYVRRAVGQATLRRPVWWGFAPVLSLVLLVLLRWGDADLRALGGAAFGLAGMILALGLAFNYRFHVYVMAEFGPRRLFDYTGLAVVLLFAGAAELGLRRLSRWRPPRRDGPLPWLGTAVATGVVLVLAVVAVPRNVSVPKRERFLSQAAEPMAWLADNVPCSGRILADRRTLATFEVFIRHAGVLEGMGPYLRPEVLREAIAELFAARQFFQDPQDGQGYLERERIAAVVVTSYNQTLGGVGGPLKVAQPKAAALAAAPPLKLVVDTGSIQVYEVISFDRSADTGGFPDVRQLPGYGCGKPVTIPTGPGTPRPPRRDET